MFSNLQELMILPIIALFGALISERASAFSIALLAPIAAFAVWRATGNVWIGQGAFLLLQTGFVVPSLLATMSYSRMSATGGRLL